MKPFTYLLGILISALLSAGCASTQTEKYQKLNYGMTEEEVKAVVGDRHQPVFLFRAPDGAVFKCHTRYFEDKCIRYNFLYRDGRLCSIIRGGRNLVGHEYAEKDKPLPYEGGMMDLVAPFFPAREIADIDFQEVDVEGKKSQDLGDRQEFGMMLAYAPVFLPAIVLAGPPYLIYYLVTREYDPPILDELGLSSGELTNRKKLGRPYEVFGDPARYGILVYRGGYRGSYGFRNDELVWIRYDFLVRGTYEEMMRKRR